MAKKSKPKKQASAPKPPSKPKPKPKPKPQPKLREFRLMLLDPRGSRYVHNLIFRVEGVKYKLTQGNHYRRDFNPDYQTTVTAEAGSALETYCETCKDIEEVS